MGSPLCDKSPLLLQDRTESVFDEFFNYTTAGLWTTAGSGGTVAADSTGGVTNVLLTTAGGSNTTDNTYIRSTNANFLPVYNTPMYCAGRLTYANQATTNANVIAGFASTVTLTVTSGLIPTASYSGAVLIKQKGNTFWSVQSSNGATKTNSDSSAVATDGTYTFSVQINNADATHANVVYFVNGQQLLDRVSNKPIVHTLAYASLANMYIIGGCTQGSSGNAQTCSFDYLAGGKLRFGL